jgi:HD-GYP domain-containing protein (c-di-GMP phosphodiesterase class II)
MGLGAPDLDRLHRGGLLHDVGKIGVPPDVLNKAGSLTPDELDVVRAHPALGARILSPIQAYADLLPLVLSHHELLDGSGYPNHLRGEEIPLLVRVLTVADVFDALVSERPYRGAWHARKALAYIAGGAGHTFDPAVASAFHEVLRRGSDDIWLAYPALKSQLERAGGFARSSARRTTVFVS